MLPNFRLFLSLITALGIFQAGPSRADPGANDPPPAENRSPYEVNLGLDVGISVGSLAVLVLPRLMAEEAVRPWCGLDCNPADVNSLDRHVIGNWSHTSDVISDAGAGVSLALPYFLNAIDVLVSDPQDGWTGFGVDTLVLMETLSVTLGAANALNFLVRRPRPLVYDENVGDKRRLLGDSSLSFPSGHTSSSFAMATAYSYTFMHRHPDSPLVVPIWLGTYALAATTGIMRTEAGEHFYTDVLAGAALGIGLGLLVPYLHLRGEDAAADGDAADRSGDPPLIVTISPMATPGGIGAALTIR